MGQVRPTSGLFTPFRHFLSSTTLRLYCLAMLIFCCPIDILAILLQVNHLLAISVDYSDPVISHCCHFSFALLFHCHFRPQMPSNFLLFAMHFLRRPRAHLLFSPTTYLGSTSTMTNPVFPVARLPPVQPDNRTAYSQHAMRPQRVDLLASLCKALVGPVDAARHSGFQPSSLERHPGC
jgi:hypothetical protein